MQTSQWQRHEPTSVFSRQLHGAMQIRGEQKDRDTAPRDCRSSDAQLRRIREGGREGE